MDDPLDVLNEETVCLTCLGTKTPYGPWQEVAVVLPDKKVVIGRLCFDCYLTYYQRKGNWVGKP